jgi:chemotaxis signal transduction protein
MSMLLEMQRTKDSLSEYGILTTALTDLSRVLFLEGLEDQEFWRYAATLASANPTAKAEIEQYLECELEQKRCILPLVALREVVPPPHQIALLPSIPAWMAGITAWHGETIAAVDLDAYLSHGATRLRSDAILLVIQQDEITLGLFVTSVRPISMLDLEHMLSEQMLAQYPHLPVGAIVGISGNALVLDVGIVLTNMIRRISETVAYG